MSDIRAAFQNGSGKAAASSKSKGDIEQIYQKKSQLEHILLRPDTYVGSVERVKELMWVFDKEKNNMVQREISYVPGLYKIFDEILVNAADNKQRDKRMDTIKIDINQETNTISIWNNGEGIPVVMHKDENMFVPTMIFGHLLTSSNYNDEEEKVTGGRNGYGAKLCNIFSTKFTVETAAKKYKKSFKQSWGDNMGKVSEPKINDTASTDYTKITFSPDLAKFKMEKLDDDIVHLMSRRAYDIAASTRGVSVFLNGDKLPVKNFKDYIDLYIRNNADDAGIPLKLITETAGERWEVGVTLSEKGFQQVSFVNSIATTKGGRHVDHVVDNVIKQLIEVIKKKNKGGIQVKPFQVKNHVWVFVNCLIVNPTFDSQTKENMTLQAKSFGSKCVLSEKFITGVTKSGIVESVLSWAKFKASTDLAKTSGSKKSKLKGIPKLEDANDAGTKNSLNCTLILTEGDSAKTLAVSGLGVVGRDLYGVFPLRGKLLNVREAAHKQILDNAEINNLIKIIGLQYKKKYLTTDDVKTLRYGKVMIMTDQDQDGSHIKGLLINFIHTNWPELLRLPFLEEFITPIVKAVKKNQEFSFYSIPEFEEWKNETENHHTFNIKYYKGLGTSTSKEAKEYFQAMDRHRILFKYNGSTDDDAIIMAFSKKCCDQRKDWLNAYMDECKHRKLVGLPDRYLYTKTTKEINYSDFINLELILFSNTDNIRSIPCLVDGFKPGQRKVLFTCFKRNDKREVKVAQLAGSVAEQSAYHHGEVSLTGTIVNLAQNFVGSNNINLLQPNGQFGTRLSGGKDSASPRYIFTMLSPLARLIFHPQDDPLLNFLNEDNQRIEPEWYLPIIPMVLVNGCEGIGTGWSTKIPNHNPRDIVQNIRRMMRDEDPKPMLPFYKNFTGEIQAMGDSRFITVGKVSILDDKKVEISELPVGTWTQNYKESTLESLLHGSEKVKSVISDYKEYHTDTTVRFVVSFAPGEFDKLNREDGGFHRVFKLTSSISISTMNAFDQNNCLRKFDTSTQILIEFYALRVEYYDKRKKYLEGMLQAEADQLSNKARFIVEKCDRTLVVENKKRKTIIEELLKRGFAPDPVKEWKRRINMEDEPEPPTDEVEEEVEVDSKKKIKKEDSEAAFQKLSDVAKFDYLLGMSMWMLTDEKKNDLLKQRDTKLSELSVLQGKTPKMLWVEDLDVFIKKLDEVEEKERAEEAQTNIKIKKSKAASSVAKGGRGKGKLSSAFDETKPNPDAILIDFRATDDIIKKYEKATAQSKGVPKVKKEPKAVKVKPEVSEEMDEFDALVEGGSKPPAKKPAVKKEPDEKKPRVKKEKANKSSDGLKQSKLDFKKKPKTKMGSDSDEDIQSIGSSDGNLDIVVPARNKPSRRAATKKIDYSALLDDDEKNSGSESDGGRCDNKPKLMDSDSEELMVIDSDESDAPVVKKKEAPTKRKLGPKVVSSPDSPIKPKQKRKKGLTSDDDTPVKKQPQKKMKKKQFESSEDEVSSVPEDSDSDFSS